MINLVGLPLLKNLSPYVFRRFNRLYFSIRYSNVSCLQQSFDEIILTHHSIASKFHGNVHQQYAYQVKVAYDWSLTRRHTITGQNIVEAINSGQRIHINSFKRVD